MSVGAHRRRQYPKKPTPKCVQCNKEDQLPNRADKLGLNCATFRDRAAAKLEKHRKAQAAK